MTLIDHTTSVEKIDEGYIGICEGCGDRLLEPDSYGKAERWANRHEMKAKARMLNTGGQPSLRTLERLYREHATNIVYTPEERAEWRKMADEIARHVKRRPGEQVEGQEPLWDDDQSTQTRSTP